MSTVRTVAKVSYEGIDLLPGEKLDLDSVRDCLSRPAPDGTAYNHEVVEQLIVEYRVWWSYCAARIANGASLIELVPSIGLDLVIQAHAHEMDKFFRDCFVLLGAVLWHFPSGRRTMDLDKWRATYDSTTVPHMLSNGVDLRGRQLLPGSGGPAWLLPSDFDLPS